MSNLEKINSEMVEKRNRLYDLGLKPPYRFEPTHTFQELHNAYGEIPNGRTTDSICAVHGRIMGRRDHGSLRFLDIYDAIGRKIQAYFSHGDTTTGVFEASDLLDVGDWIGIKGLIMKTRRGELSIKVSQLYLLGKCLYPAPSIRNKLKIETRLRRPWYYLRFDEGARQKLFLRAEIKKEVRSYMNRLGFVEMDTPFVSRNYGGAGARPFVTYSNALQEQMYLSISPEPYLKEAISAGFDKVFTIARNFRNEDIDTTHNPEFEMLECYAVGQDYHNMMDLTESLVAHLSMELHGKTVVTFKDQEINLTPPWRRVSMVDLVLKHYEFSTPSLDELIGLMEGENIEYPEDVSFHSAINLLFENTIQDSLIQPTFVIDYPKEISPLTREHRSKPDVVERFELFIMGIEYANAYSELNNPEEQERRLMEQEEERKGGNLEAYPLDWDFIDAIYTGFPTTGGLGLGIDRLVMLLTDSHAIRDIIFAPMVKSMNNKSKDKM